MRFPHLILVFLWSIFLQPILVQGQMDKLLQIAKKDSTTIEKQIRDFENFIPDTLRKEMFKITALYQNFYKNDITLNKPPENTFNILTNLYYATRELERVFNALDSILNLRREQQKLLLDQIHKGIITTRKQYKKSYSFLLGSLGKNYQKLDRKKGKKLKETFYNIFYYLKNIRSQHLSDSYIAPLFTQYLKDTNDAFEKIKKEELEKIKIETEKLEANFKEGETRNKDLKRENENLEKKKKEIERNFDKFQEKLKFETGSINRKKNNLEWDLTNLNTQLSKIKNELENVQKDKDKLAENNEIQEEKLSNLDTKAKRLGIEVKILEGQKRDIENDNLNLENINNEKDKYIKQARNRLILSILFGFVALILFIDKHQKQKELKKTKIKLEEQNNLKDTYYNELNHRIVNNLFMVGALLVQQARELRAHPKAQEVLMETKSRLDTIKFLHKMLEGTNQLKSDLKAYIKSLVINFPNPKQKNVVKEFDLDNVNCGLSFATSLGFITNEILTNAMKHAFKETPNPLLKVSLKKKGKILWFTIIDNGQGLPEGFNSDYYSVGINLVIDLVNDKRGTFTINKDFHENGSKFQMQFPLP